MFNNDTNSVARRTAFVTQLVECLAFNQVAGGSKPSEGAYFLLVLSFIWVPYVSSITVLHTHSNPDQDLCKVFPSSHRFFENFELFHFRSKNAFRVEVRAPEIIALLDLAQHNSFEQTCRLIAVLVV